MTTLITDILDYQALQDEIRDGWVTERFHPEFPELAILNYTDRCQFEKHWTPVTMITRGLIYNRDTLEVVARGFPKFFNYGDPQAGVINLDAKPYGVLDKIDGSLGIQYTRPDGLEAIATRGSFVSEQAVWATAWLQASDASEARSAPGGLTQLWEIIFPENRIVVDYGTRAECVLLGFLDIATAEYDWPLAAPGFEPWGVAIPEEFRPQTVRDAFALPPRPNAEGVVVWLTPFQAVKFKQDDYIALHRMVSNLTVKEVWRQLRDGTFEEFAPALPDEFHQWARDAAAPLLAEFDRIVEDAHDWLATVRSKSTDRKAQAQWAERNVPKQARAVMWMIVNGQDYSTFIWRKLEPKMSGPSVAAMREAA
jgi:RNA ligase